MRNKDSNLFRGSFWNLVGPHAKIGVVVWCIFP
jgi:hypothetical protein